MTISVEKIDVWRGEVEDKPGALADVLGTIPGTDVIMGYSYPGGAGRKAILELFPVQQPIFGLAASKKPTLLVRGDDRLGLTGAFYRALADEGINMDFLVALAVGDQYSVVVGFATDEEADRAAAVIRKLGSG